MTPGMFDDAWKGLAMMVVLIVACAFFLGRCSVGCEYRLRIEHVDGGTR